MEQPTINENPTILSVDTRRKMQQEQPLQHFAAPTSVADWAVRQALTEASLSSSNNSNRGGGGVTLLKNMGVKLPETREMAPFIYAPLRWTGENDEQQPDKAAEDDDDENPTSNDKLDVDDVFEIIRNIQDPEHPLTLEQLGVVSRQQVVWQAPSTESSRQRLEVRFTPTIPHCSMATQIGLCLRVKLDRSLPASVKTAVKIEPGTHASENAINKQLADKERVCAALENKHLLGIVNRCIMNGMTGNMV